MPPILQSIRSNWMIRPTIVRIGLLIVTGLFAFLALAIPVTANRNSFELKTGDVASQDIQAPRNLSYISEILTNQARIDAENSVPPIFLPSDPSISRKQIEKLKVALNYINNIRFDTYSSVEQKTRDLLLMSDLPINKSVAGQILVLSDQRWEEVSSESVTVLETAMRNTIRENQLNDIMHSIPSLISYSLSQDQAVLTTIIVTPFLVPNSLLSIEQTNSAKLKARNAVQPITREYITGQTIIQRGQIVTPVQFEALQQFGLIQQMPELQNTIATIALVVMVCLFIALYFNRRKSAPLNDFKSLVLISITFLIFLYGARLVIPFRTIIPYLFPVSAFALTIGSLYSLDIGLVFSLVLSILTAYGLSNALDLTLFYILGSLCGVLILGKGRRIANFFWAGLAIGVVGITIILAYRLTDGITDWIGIATLMGVTLLNGLASASLTLLFQFLFAQILGLTTAMQLLDLSRPDNPLLQFILSNAPGTYQHSLQVANLAEQAADAIGADSLLVHVGCLYHDAGKAVNPTFFIENQVPGKLNSHDDLDPSVSAAIIIRHIIDGVQLGKKHRLPPRIMDFMLEHHGTLITRYQYARALEIAGNNPELVDPEKFRYPGPAPRTRETALLMLADGCEARARAEIPKNEDELRAMIRKVFEFCQREGQLDNTAITLRDLSRISDSFFKTLQNTYHPRIVYPEIKPQIAIQANNRPAAQEKNTLPQNSAEEKPA